MTATNKKRKMDFFVKRTIRQICFSLSLELTHCATFFMIDIEWIECFFLISEDDAAKATEKKTRDL